MIAGTHAVLWLRQDRPGNDACRFAEAEGGFLIDGSSSAQNGDVTRYRVRVRDDGTTRRVRIGASSRVFIRRDPAGVWTMNGTSVPEVAEALDIDLGFTPASHTLPIRRLKLAVGDTAELVAARFDAADTSLTPSRQIYRRLSGDSYEHVVADNGVTTRLRVDAMGIVRDCDGLWRARD